MSKKINRTICFDSHSKCGALVHVEDGKIVTIDDRSGSGLDNKEVDEKDFRKPQVVIKPDQTL